MAERYWIETLGCPKNQVDSDKLVGTLTADGMELAPSAEDADLLVVNTCAFIEAARQESIDTVLALSKASKRDARLVVTGCMAERYGDELADALPEVDLVAPFGFSLTGGGRGPASDGRPGPLSANFTAADPTLAGSTPVVLGSKPPGIGARVPAFDLLNLARPRAEAPWAYLKVAEGCDRNCGFCAIPSFRGRQRSRTMGSILAELDELTKASGPLREVVLVAQDLASYGLDRSGDGSGDRSDRRARGSGRPIIELLAAMAGRVDWVRLLYLYPSSLDDGLVDAILSTGVPYFDLSLQHVSRPLLKRMRRWGAGERFLERIGAIREQEPSASFRSSFIIGYPGETESDHDLLLQWLEEARLDWVGFFPFSSETGTYAAELPDVVPHELVAERIGECSELQDAITRRCREDLVGSTVRVLVDGEGEGRTFREAPEIDGIVTMTAFDDGAAQDRSGSRDRIGLGPVVGTFVDALVTGADGPDLVAEVSRG